MIQLIVLNILLQIKVVLFSLCVEDDGTKKQVGKCLDISFLKMIVLKTVSVKQLVRM